MNVLRDLPVLWQLAKGMPNGPSHGEQLNRFYAPQAQRYDAFRERLLQGRRELIEQLPIGAGARVVELGAGTGRNVEFFGPRAAQFTSIDLVDICAPLLAIARGRFVNARNVRIVQASAETYRPAEPVDCVYFCYSLSMMLNWPDAVRNAVRMLKPGGLLAVADFYLPGGSARLSLRMSDFWRRWFQRDGVEVSDQLLPYLQWQSRTVHLLEAHARIPYLPILRAPFFTYIGQRN